MTLVGTRDTGDALMLLCATHPDSFDRKMLIRVRDQKAIAAGKITLAFRRWKRPTVKSGGTLRTAVGVLAIDAVERVAESQIDERQARAAGFDSRDALLAELGKRPGGDLYRIALRLAGEDPRAALRQKAELTAEDRAEIERRLARLDRASPRGPWTETLLALIAERPATRAADLAAAASFEVAWLKTRVRRLKELGLTESLGTGYRLSPRGKAFWRSGLHR